MHESQTIISEVVTNAQLFSNMINHEYLMSYFIHGKSEAVFKLCTSDGKYSLIIGVISVLSYAEFVQIYATIKARLSSSSVEVKPFCEIVREEV